MEGYLPIPQVHTHEGPTETILRFSSSWFDSAPQVFLHAIGATATFGKSFSPSRLSSFTTASNPITLVYPLDEQDGCTPLNLPEERPSEYVVLLDRGGCTFLDKLVHATRAGASGAIVAGLPPSSSSSPDDEEYEGLLRPSAEGEAAALLKEVSSSGLLYVDWRTGDVLRSHASEGTGMLVDVLPLDGQVATDTESVQDYNSAGRGRKAREGRVGVGEWPIWNLRIVETL